MYTPGAQAQNHSVGISGDLVCLLLWSLPGDTDVHLPLKTTLNFFSNLPTYFHHCCFGLGFSVSCNYHNRLRPTRRLKITVYPLTVLEASNLESRRGQDPAASGGLRGGGLLASSCFWCSRSSLACHLKPRSLPPSPHSHLHPLPVCLL